MDNSDEHCISYVVVKNDEEQYSIWPSGKNVPAGWRSIGDEQTKMGCLEFIEQNWKDMRPLSLRKWASQ
jgi:MbtH protein